VLRRLLERERGAYWTFLFFTGDRYLIGASPERHVSIHGGDVRMNPISGTFRLPRAGEPTDRLHEQLIDFLHDEKEIYELFMVVDEELKMMCDICKEGGQVLGPFLKPMSRLIHTEYLLAGRTDRDPREVLRDTMYAATVTGSPVENACRLIKQYETEGRGYYGAALAVLGRDGQGGPVVDSPIVIRTADVDLEGRLRVTAGATLVRDSDPAYEVAETHAKAAGILSAFGLVPPAPATTANVSELVSDEDVLLTLNQRNRRLSSFWLTDQAGSPPDPRLRGQSVVVLDGEDDFVNMLRHVLGVLGLTSTVVRYDDYTEGCLDGHDLVIVGPGPGDPRDDDDQKMVTLRRATAKLLAERRPLLAVCLGHQALCHELGIPLAYKDIVFQGTQSPVEIEGRTERVGFYNTFVGRLAPGAAPPEGVRVDADPTTGDIHAVYGPHYRGIQFHAESILTEHGYDLLHRLVSELLLG
jgi:phenazine biosynthesis protein phzE